MDKYCLALLLVMLAHGVALARTLTQTDELMELSLAELMRVEVTTASKTREQAEQAPATIYVITGEQIEKLGLHTLKEVLALVPGVDTSDNDFFLQGGQRGFMGPFSQSLLLIDGREINNLIAGETFISNQFRTHNIKQIEVIAGPGSALYGANAMGGVINIITKPPAELTGLQFGVNYASHRGRQLDLVAGGEQNGWKYRAGVAWYSSDGEDFSEFLSTPALASPAADNNAYRHLPASYGYENHSEALPISLYLEKGGWYGGAEYYQNRSGRGTASIQWDYLHSEDYRELLMNYLGYRRSDLADGKLSARLEYRHYWERFWGNHTESTGPLENPHTGETLTHEATRADVEAFRGFYSNRRSKGSRKHGLTLEGIYRANPEQTVIAGLDYEHSDIISAAWSRVEGRHPQLGPDNNQPEFRNYKWGLYGQYQRHFSEHGLTLTLGARLSGHQRYQRKLLPRGGLVFTPRKGTVFKALYGKSFREPVVFELSSNPDIQPMEMDTYELGWHQYLGKHFKNEAVAFFNQASDLIVSDDVIAITNRGSLESRGFENTFTFGWERFKGFINYTYMDTVTVENEGEISEIYDIPRHKANMGLKNHDRTNSSLGQICRYRARVDTEYQGDIHTLDDYLVWDLTLRAASLPELDRRLGLSLSVKNLFNRRYYHPEPRDANALQHPQPGRAYWLRLEWAF